MTSTTCTFTGTHGELAARLELPEGPVRAAALFAHCFTCGKDLRVERQLTSALTAEGYAVLSFDFAGLGRSGGDFADSTFASNVADLRAARKKLLVVCGVDRAEATLACIRGGLATHLVVDKPLALALLEG